MPGRHTIFHAATEADWDARTATHYRPAGLDTEGFIHCSTADQLPAVLNRVFPGRTDIVVLTINLDGVTAPVVWEDLYDHGADFPHVYGPLDLAAVIGAARLGFTSSPAPGNEAPPRDTQPPDDSWTDR